MPKALGFNIGDCVSKDRFNYRSKRQQENAVTYDVDLVFMWAYRPKWAMMPKYVQKTVADAGYEAVRLGSSTYRYTVWGLRRCREVMKNE